MTVTPDDINRKINEAVSKLVTQLEPIIDEKLLESYDIFASGSKMHLYRSSLAPVELPDEMQRPVFKALGKLYSDWDVFYEIQENWFALIFAIPENKKLVIKPLIKPAKKKAKETKEETDNRFDLLDIKEEDE